MKLFPDLAQESFIQTGDFFKASLGKTKPFPGITWIIFTVFFGKAVKMASGFPHIHAAKSELTMKMLSEWAQTITKNKALTDKIARSNTARHALEFIYPEYPELIEYIGNKIVGSAMDKIFSSVLWLKKILSGNRLEINLFCN